MVVTVVAVANMGFQVPHRTAPNPTEFEELYKDSWNIFGTEVIRLQELGRAAALQGKKSVASKYYRGANIYFYLMYLAIAAKEKQGLLLLKVDVPCYVKEIEDQYKLQCVEDNLPCLSSDFDTDYTAAWESLLALFGIDRDTDVCDEADEDCRCVGINQMIIDGESDCNAFIIGPCEENTLPDSGEFNPCEFVIEEFTEALGDSVYDNCGDTDEALCNCN